MSLAVSRAVDAETIRSIPGDMYPYSVHEIRGYLIRPRNAVSKYPDEQHLSYEHPHSVRVVYPPFSIKPLIPAPSWLR